MKKYKFYFTDGTMKYIEAKNFENAVNIAFDKENVEVDINKTVMAFFRNQ